MRTFLQDLRFAARLFRRSPGFTAIAVAAIAIGIGANSAIFSVVNGVLLKTLPYRDPDGIVMVWERNLPRGRETNVAGPANFLAWREENDVFEQMAAVTMTFGVNLTGAGEPVEVKAQAVNAEFFPILGVSPELGRAFSKEEEDGRRDVVVISHRLWQQRLRGADVVGQAVTLNGRAQVIAGIMPPGFHFRDRTVDVWYPLAIPAEARVPRGRSLVPLARLKPGVTVQEMDTISARLTARWPQFDTGWVTNVRPIAEEITGDVRPALLVLLGAVGFVLLIACANVANLLLARSTARQRELALRAALGADRGRLARQLLAESLLLAAGGGLLGLALAWAGVHLLTATLADQVAFPRVDAIGIDARVLAFTAAIAVLSGVVFGLAPALASASINLNDALKEGGRTGSSGRLGRLRGLFVIVEVALALVLLAGAGLLLRSFARILDTDPGFDPEHVLTMQLTLPSAKYGDAAKRGQFYQSLLDSLGGVPGLRAAGTVSFLPMNGLAAATGFTIIGQPVPAAGQEPVAEVRIYLGDYFQAMGIPLRAGRLFTDREQREPNSAIVINEALARQYFPNQDPIGQHLKVSWNGEGPDEIVGIVGDVKMTSIEETIRPAVYYPYSRTPYSGETLVVRAAGDPAALAPAVIDKVHAIDADLPVSAVRPMTAVLARSMAQRRLLMVLLAVFAGVALVLATVGIYGVMSYMVSQRTQEIGIRMALGAERGEVVRMVLGHALRLAAAGLAAGAAVGLALTGLLQSLLYDVQPTDPLTFGAVAALLMAVAAVAGSVPALRATRIDPLAALRAD
jgi:putative ABC transport system permease protein